MKIARKTRRARRRAVAITTTISGIVTYRTRRPLTEKKAVQFARMVQANPRFLDASVVKARKVNHFHVCFLPNSPERITAMLEAENKKDVDAMRRDGRHFLYSPCAAPRVLVGHTDVYDCIGITGEYETTIHGAGACSCPHYTYRRSSSGGECKHIKELRRRVEAGIVPAPVVPIAPIAPIPSVKPANGYGSAEWNKKVFADFG